MRMLCALKLNGVPSQERKPFHMSPAKRLMDSDPYQVFFSRVGACKVTTEFLRIEFVNFPKFDFHGLFPRIGMLEPFSPLPPSLNPPCKTQIAFLLSSRHLWRRKRRFPVYRATFAIVSISYRMQNTKSPEKEEEMGQKQENPIFQCFHIFACFFHIVLACLLDGGNSALVIGF